MKIQTLALMQIILMIGMTMSNAYSISEIDKIPVENAPSILSTLIKFFTLIPSVSAIESSDFQQGAQTCLKTKAGLTCQEMLASDCASLCDGACVPASIANVPECKPGTCYSNTQGTCQVGASKLSCEGSGGQWSADPNGNIPQCKRGCCILGNQAAFVGSQECTVRSAQLGVTKNFKSEITTEIACLAFSGGDSEGACVIEEDFENTCKFTTKSSCLKINGEFHSGYLCSASELNTNCQKQKTAKCVDGKDEIYWFDSCGNKENIYSANKEQSWNSGKVLSKSASCDVTGNGATCGNCNYILGTKCGVKTSTIKLSDNTISAVCRPLGCVDDDGKDRKNGESWCSFDSSIGVDQGRSADVVGSRHFRKICIDGEVRTEPCQDFRNGVCVESKNTEIAGGFSSAACKINTWQQCLNYNLENQTDKCLTNSDCFVNQVKLSDAYDFSVCVPKVNPGFDMTAKPESAEAICNMGSQKCNVVYVKTLFSGWKCKQNCECLEKEFAEKMSNLCVSLGDCGPKVNIAGKQTDNYRISNSPKLSAAYLAGLANYRNPVAGQFLAAGASSSTAASLGIPSEIAAGEVGDAGSTGVDFASTAGSIIGISAVAMAYAAPHLFAAGSSALAFAAGAGQVSGGIGAGAFSTVIGSGGAVGTATQTITVVSSTVGTTAGTVGAGGTAVAEGSVVLVSGSQGGAAGAGAVAANPGWAAAGGAFAGAGIGLAVTSLLLKLSGIGAGLPSGVTYTLLAAGTAAGAIMGYNLALSGTWTGGTTLGLVAVWAAVIVIAVIIIMKLFGIGKSRSTVVEFQCQPWEAPTGGLDCAKCGADGLPCSKYSCQSLGQTCQLVNEGTENTACVDVSPNDVSAPVISAMEESLLDGFTYSSVTDQGYTVKGPEGCVPAYTNVQFGIKLNEASQCKFDTTHTGNYKDMEFSFGGRNLYLQNHTMSLSIPSLESLGLNELNSTSQADYNLFVRCQDKNGNSNIREYSINFCVSQGIDVTPPIVVRAEPKTNFVAYNAASANIKVYTNEPATCKISTSDTIYDNMLNEMNCNNDASEQSIFGYSCTSQQGLQGNSTTFYVRCQDQPWLNATDIANGKSRNENRQSLVIGLRKSLTPLKIDSLEPNNRTVTSNTYPATVELLARTSGGMDGNAICALNISGSLVNFLNTGFRQHSWALNQMTPGNKTAQVICKDDAGNVAERTSTFSVTIDTEIPIITRVYGKTNNLYVITNEQSQCSYSNTQCDFDFDSGNVMSGIDKIHTTYLNKNKDYYIACKDRYGNKAGQCTIVVRKGGLENA